MKKYSDTIIIVPAYNEGKVIEKNLREVLDIFPNVVCVNDNSSDDTAEKARATGAKVIDHATNIGQGGAIQTGIEYGIQKGYKFFGTIDADGQHSVDDLARMMDILHKDKDTDIIFGSRFLGKKPENMPVYKRILLKCAIRFSNLTTKTKMTDTHNGLRAFNLKTAKLLDLKMSNFAHASEILQKISKNKLIYSEFPTTVKYTDYSKQKGQPAINAVNIVVETILNKGK